MTGFLALAGGDEFHPGNEACDALLAAAARPGPAFLVPTAAARHRPESAVATARRWFAPLGVEIEPLTVLRRRDAADPALAARAREAGLAYLCGGDPGIVPEVLAGSAVWEALRDAWVAGAALAGSSAGAMALCSEVLVRDHWPDHSHRRPVPGLGLVGATAVLPHYDTFGAGWVESARAALPDATLLGIDERTAAVWDGTGWRCHGPGRVTVLSPCGGVETAGDGEEITTLTRPLGA